MRPSSIEEFNSAPHSCGRSELGERLKFTDEATPETTASLISWQMETDDGPLFSYLYKNFSPRRHLEFGTWQGYGTSLCLKACSATVWTMNLPDGEAKPDGSWAYGERVTKEEDAPPGAVSVNFGEDEEGPRTYHRTDAASYIGRLYREQSLGHRVCQIYCDSRQWDHSAYPHDFFDSILIDGGHTSEIVVSDTRKALNVLRPGGMLMWHDFCPVQEVLDQHESVRGVCRGVESILPEIVEQMETLIWIRPSWILLGVKKQNPL